MGVQMPRQTAFIFDVDGTLTPSRQEMDKEFQKWFTQFQEKNFTYLVTGSDQRKTYEQVGPIVYNFCDRVYQCSGNEVWEQDKIVHSNDWKISEEVKQFLEEMLEESNFKKRIGLHIDERVGLCNFSILGRGTESSKADAEQYNNDRKEYQYYDKRTNEREYICKKFNKQFESKGVRAQIAGSTGVDIMQVGSDKRQILKDFADKDVKFFGDMMQPGGNDAPLKDAIIERKNKNDACYQVGDWRGTFSLLKGLVK